MDKKMDFGNDLSAMAGEIDADIGDVLQALTLQKKKGLPKVVEINAAPVSTPHSENPTSAPAQIVPTTEVRADQPQRRSRRELRMRTKPDTVIDVPRQNVSTRLRPDTNALLTEAALRQKLKNVSPNTRQDIIEVALQEWLKRHGYGKGTGADDSTDDDDD